MQLSNCCTDQLLAVIGTNCKSLEVLDAEEDSEMMTTDHGLSFLTNCVKLTTIILNDAGDEYDYEDRYFGITGIFLICNLLKVASSQKSSSNLKKSAKSLPWALSN